jgi:hypothetical protein
VAAPKSNASVLSNRREIGKKLGMAGKPKIIAAVEAKYSGLLREQTLAGFCKSAEDLVRTTEVTL